MKTQLKSAVTFAATAAILALSVSAFAQDQTKVRTGGNTEPMYMQAVSKLSKQEMADLRKMIREEAQEYARGGMRTGANTEPMYMQAMSNLSPEEITALLAKIRMEAIEAVRKGHRDTSNSK